ncbi:GspE/PulE family protein [Lacrimispora sp. 210928-DFI.3.58]|uniref:GspE/PulE family protein n=1 Tax=Lacrimispora sp. 210928-DFI.3.58 TaxID=2883214 RepID=UPI0015B5FDA0|nr:GspE/PulE family protein [Lacrimispora sp. 210928-DFI.3.58]MCB7320947.1 GspE/PulE family protein [Lacrimispora sp. 210928-DFI.3.58]
MPEKITLEGLLVEKGYLTENQLNRILLIKERNPKTSVPGLLLELGYVTEEALIECEGARLGIPVMHLAQRIPDKKASVLLPAVFAEKNRVLPIGVKEEELILAFSFPLDHDIAEEAATLTGMRVKPVFVLAKELDTAIRTVYGSSDRAREDGIAGSGETELLLRERVESAPVVRLVNEIIEAAYRENASDIHVEPGKEKLTIRIRINGDLVIHKVLDPGYHRPMVTRLKLVSGMDIAEKRLPQDGKYHYEKGDVSTDLRISTLPTIYGEKVVLRLLGNNRDLALMDLHRLGMEKEQAAIFEKMLSAPYGMILVTGPTGSGKTTTLYAALSRMAIKKINVVTVEDPVEKMIEGVTQVQVNPKAGLTFAKTLRSILRQDPDVIMVGEMRDEETASIGIRAAITGHLVLSTLHTNDCASVIDRLRNMGVPPYMIADSLTGVVAQRLVKVLCPFCRKQVPLDRSQRELAHLSGIREPKMLWSPTGCPRCKGTGYIRRRAVYEIMEADEQLKNLIMSQASVKEIQNHQEKRGIKPLKEYVLKMVLDGETGWEEAKRLVYYAE